MVYLLLALIVAICFYPEAIFAAAQGGNPAADVGADNIAKMGAVVSALSVSSQRLVDIIKGFSKWLSEEKTDKPDQERWRKIVLQLLSIAASLFIVWMAQDALQTTLGKWLESNWNFLALGLLGGGGSSFWDSFSKFVTEAKNIKKADATDKNLAVQTKKASIPTG
jgi:hypothetical protein